MKQSAETRVRDELKLAHSLLEQFLGVSFRAPKPYIGDKHRSRFIEISSSKDLIHASMVQGAYDDEVNGMFVPDSIMTEEDGAAKRVFTFVHECGHALSTQQNPKLKIANISRLLRSKTKWVRAKGRVYVVFSEGLSTYLAIQTCLHSGRNDLAEHADLEHKRLVDFFTEWTSPSSRHFKLMAEIYRVDPNNWQGVLEGYLTGDSMAVSLEYYKYDLGYFLMRTLQPDSRMVLQMIQRPPSVVRHILHPEIYRSENLLEN